MKLVIFLISLTAEADPNSILLPKLLPHKDEHSSILVLHMQARYSGVLGKIQPIATALKWHVVVVHSSKRKFSFIKVFTWCP